MKDPSIKVALDAIRYRILKQMLHTENTGKVALTTSHRPTFSPFEFIELEAKTVPVYEWRGFFSYGLTDLDEAVDAVIGSNSPHYQKLKEEVLKGFVTN